MKKIAIITILMITTTFLVGCGKSEQTKQNEQKNKEQITTENKNTSFIYLVKLDKQTPTDQPLNEIANLNCVKNLTKVNLNKKVSPKESLEILFGYKDYNKEELYNVFDGIDNIKIKELILKNDFAILKLNEIAKFSKEQDIENLQISTCAAQQIKKTLEQFDNIAGADIYVGENVLN